jgi:tetratricopeptide (TPR) repeat protein
VPTAALLTILIACLVASLLRLYNEPQIFAYSVPFGYWPGSLYDENVPVTVALWAHRAYSLLIALTLGALAVSLTDPETLTLDRNAPHLPALAFAVLAALGAFAVHRSGPDLGFDFDRAVVEDRLSRHLTTEHFELFVDPSITDEELTRLSTEHEFRYHELVETFGRGPSNKIRSYIYRGIPQKKELMGAARTQIARPWAHEIHIHGFAIPHRVLKHELAHIFAGEFASGLFKVPAAMGLFVNIGIVEGLAVATDWPARELTVHGWARAMRAIGLAPDPRTTLYPTGFWAISSARAYTVAGSFLRYLIDEYGIEKTLTLYRSNDFLEAYGRSLDALVAEWESFIDTQQISDGDLLFAEHRFKRPGIFQKVCAHEVARLSSEGYLLLGNGNLRAASEKLERVTKYQPGNNAHLLALSRAHSERELPGEALRYAQRAVDAPGITVKSRGEALSVLADLDWRASRNERARTGFGDVLALHLSDVSDRMQLAKIASLDRPPKAASILRDYLLGELEGGKAAVRLGALSREYPGDSLIRYLYGRRLEAIGAYDEGVAELEAATSVGLPGTQLNDEATMTLGRLLLAAGRGAEARAVFKRQAKSAPTAGKRLLASDWASRSRYASSSTAAAARTAEE